MRQPAQRPDRDGWQPRRSPWGWRPQHTSCTTNRMCRVGGARREVGSRGTGFNPPFRYAAGAAHRGVCLAYNGKIQERPRRARQRTPSHTRVRTARSQAHTRREPTAGQAPRRPPSHHVDYGAAALCHLRSTGTPPIAPQRSPSRRNGTAHTSTPPLSTSAPSVTHLPSQTRRHRRLKPRIPPSSSPAPGSPAPPPPLSLSLTPPQAATLCRRTSCPPAPPTRCRPVLLEQPREPSLFG